LGLSRWRREHALGMDLHAAAGVFGIGTGWPDIIVAAIMASLALQGATLVIRQSLGELRQSIPVPVH
jgi:Co/Zn/Cd efflux system component